MIFLPYPEWQRSDSSTLFSNTFLLFPTVMNRWTNTDKLVFHQLDLCESAMCIYSETKIEEFSVSVCLSTSRGEDYYWKDYFLKKLFERKVRKTERKSRRLNWNITWKPKLPYSQLRNLMKSQTRSTKTRKEAEKRSDWTRIAKEEEKSVKSDYVTIVQCELAADKVKIKLKRVINLVVNSQWASIVC